MFISIKETRENPLELGKVSMGEVPVLSHVIQKEPNVGSLFFGAFSSDSSHKVMKGGVAYPGILFGRGVNEFK
jgi:hypothetical protein